MANGIAIKDVETKLQSLTGEEVIPISSGADEPEVVEASVLKEYAQGGTYKKPSGGIPKTDLASGVQSSLNKADTAVQIETDPTVPSWAKAESKPSYTALEVGAVPTTRKVNNKALSDDITLIASDVGALPDNTIIPAAQIQSDWNQSTTAALDYIKNKPTIPTVPTNVSAFNNDAGYLTSHQDISGKADKAISATNGNFAALDSNGNLTDSGHKHSDYLTSHQDLSNYVQKSSTAGLLKNDGTVDTSTYLTQHQDLSNYIQKSSTSGLVKNDGTIDTSTYLTQHQDISNYIQKSNTAGLVKNDGTIDTSTYLTTAPVTSVNGQTGAVTIATGENNVIESVTFNGTAATVTNKTAAITATIPTVPSNIVTGLNSSGVATAYTIKVVNSLPGTTDPSTIYLVTGS